MTKTPTTCQICGRGIQAKTGLIAHHGYKRPGNGWQTASCYGAKFRPYEVACDAIEGAINACERFIAGANVRIAEMLSNPPAEIVENRKVGWNTYTSTLARPEGFDPFAKSPGSYQQGGRGHYECLFHQRLNDWRRKIDAAQTDIEFLTDRLATWAPAQAA